MAREHSYVRVRVVSVIDGDTYLVIGFSRPAVCRLVGFDAPEPGQARSQECLDRVRDLVDGQFYMGRIVDVDKYQRVVVELRMGSGRALAERLLRLGLGWAVPQFAPDPAAYLVDQQWAKEHGRGIWQDPYPMPPWKWRKYMYARCRRPHAAWHRRHRGG